MRDDLKKSLLKAQRKHLMTEKEKTQLSRRLVEICRRRDDVPPELSSLLQSFMEAQYSTMQLAENLTETIENLVDDG